MGRRQNPPPVIAGLYVVGFAHADRSVRFEQRYTLHAGGKWLGRVPCLALCRSFEKAEFMIQYCSKQWKPLGIAGGYKSIEEANIELNARITALPQNGENRRSRGKRRTPPIRPN
jgi:hypothetical protein